LAGKTLRAKGILKVFLAIGFSVPLPEVTALGQNPLAHTAHEMVSMPFFESKVKLHYSLKGRSPELI